jgi:hypothetical protein
MIKKASAANEFDIAAAAARQWLESHGPVNIKSANDFTG